MLLLLSWEFAGLTRFIKLIPTLPSSQEAENFVSKTELFIGEGPFEQTMSRVCLKNVYFY